MHSLRLLLFLWVFSGVTSVFAEEARKKADDLVLVSLVPSVTEILFALGVGDQLRGVTTFCDYPEEALAIPKVGDFSNPSIERIVGIEPDLVFATIPEQQRTVENLINLGVRTEVVSPESIGDILLAIEQIGDWIGASSRAAEIVEEMSAQLGALEKRVRTRKKPKVYVELDVNPLFTAGRGSFVNELLERAGGENIVESRMGYIAINAELIIARDPEVIVLTHPGSGEDMASRAGWDVVSAVRNGRIVDDIDPNLIMRPGPRCVQGAVELFNRFYPDVE
jgi:iron complex transport system substrate-binding protein